MNNENTRKLIADFPELYRGSTKPITESLMGFGFECGDGWFEIIYQLSERITDLSKHACCAVPEAMQVKEKYGGLRFYIGEADRAITGQIYEWIDEAEIQSEKTCEDCGNLAKQRDRKGWIYTRCDPCMIKRDYRKSSLKNRTIH